MVNRHHWQVFTNHFGDQTAPKPGTDDDMIGFDCAAMGDDALDATVFHYKRLGRCVGEACELACRFRLIDQLACNSL